MRVDTGEYHYSTAEAMHSHDYLLPTLYRLLKAAPSPASVFELGCGNGFVANELSKVGYAVTAVDPATKGIGIAKEAFPNCRFTVGSAYDDLAARYGIFDIVLSLEVVEHVFYPRKYAATVASLMKPDGIAIISTPYHGYLKNLALALLNKWDSHMNPLWDYGHIKLWSPTTLVRLFEEVGLRETGFYRVGRIPQLAKSMVMVFRK
jgi:2-polyprenyl-3-methyl-5-hydroxy-6-metoxy-1,4-benzoquinol methylase